jgi:hypothetical protein
MIMQPEETTTESVDWHQKSIDALIEESEKQKKRADFRYPIGKRGEISLQEVHNLVKKNVTDVYKCRYDLEGPKGSEVYVLVISPR